METPRKPLNKYWCSVPNYFICIKDFKTETNTSLKLNLFSFFICGCQHYQRKMICPYVYISDIRQIVGLADEKKIKIDGMEMIRNNRISHVFVHIVTE
jgi:hypothetical protein